jgi:large subunit ribosomal protein L32
MAVPKRKHSRSRRDKKRANWKLKTKAMAKCNHCMQPIIPHRICPNCGYYGGVEVIQIEEER